MVKTFFGTRKIVVTKSIPVAQPIIIMSGKMQFLVPHLERASDSGEFEPSQRSWLLSHRNSQ